MLLWSILGPALGIFSQDPERHDGWKLYRAIIMRLLSVFDVSEAASQLLKGYSESVMSCGKTKTTLVPTLRKQNY